MRHAHPIADTGSGLSGNDAASRVDRRVERTRHALFQAFEHLLLVARRRRRDITAAAIAAHANVGRSTFYEHFASADALLLEAIRTPLTALADAAAGQGDPERVTRVMSHFWENRANAREILSGQLELRLARLLGEMIAERLATAGFEPALPLPIAVTQLAAAALAPLRSWLTAEAPCSPEALAAVICRSGVALTDSLRR